MAKTGEIQAGKQLCEKEINENENKLRTPLKIADKLFIELNTSTQAKLNSLKTILNKYDILEDEISIYLTSN